MASNVVTLQIPQAAQTPQTPQVPQTSDVNPIEAKIDEAFDRLISCVNQRRAEHKTKFSEIQARPPKEKPEKGAPPALEICVTFLSDTTRLEKDIAGVGEIIEEEIAIVPKYDLMRSEVAVGKQGEAVGELFNPYGVAVDENTGTIYIAEGYGFNRISVFSEKGIFLQIFTHQSMSSPCGIVIHKDGIYVTDSFTHLLYHFKIEKEIRFIAKFGSNMGSSDLQLNNPRGLTVSKEGDLFIADCNNDRIKILSIIESMRFKRNVKNEYMMKPQDVKLTSDQIFILCSISPCIHVLSYTGDMIRSVVTRGEGMQVTKAYFFCLDAGKNSLISDFGTHNVKIFSKDGTLIHTIGQEGEEKGMLFSTRGVVLTKDENLVIVSHHSLFGLQVFSCK